MAHFAKINDYGVVETVVVVPDSQEYRGNEYLNELGLEGDWLRTSYNTLAGTHLLGGVPFRYNHASIGGTFDPSIEPDGAFVPPYPSEGEWVLDQDTQSWVEASNGDS